MHVLVVGSGVIGTVYGAVLASSGATVDVLDHGPRTAEVAARGLRAYDVACGSSLEAAVRVYPTRTPSHTTSSSSPSPANVSLRHVQR